MHRLPSSDPGTGFIARIKQLFGRQPNGSTASGPHWEPVRPVSIEVAQRTDIGRQREHNEDNVAYIIPKARPIMDSKGALFIVADGMGGHAAGEVASGMAVEVICHIYYQDEDSDVLASLQRAIKAANDAIYQHAIDNALHNGMGTTCVVAVLRGTMLYIANIGDSRAYLIRRGQARQITLDHSWVAEQVRAGELSVEEARYHAMRNLITRSLGATPEVEIDFFVEQVEAGDQLVLCSDGLSGMVQDEEICQTVQQCSPQESVLRLVERANAAGGVDNITVLVAHISTT
ncbi:MAG: Stp1/IreP family PP2C-type Ser/Thr phosphatase [Ktedonobacteraceae bacterium]|nr:Stp1/IreP family PP2C-type Ser/Thr phosphatase [Ktedonobacteraceae bacterium]